jgi:hypothetical protein
MFGINKNKKKEAKGLVINGFPERYPYEPFQKYVLHRVYANEALYRHPTKRRSFKMLPLGSVGRD